MMDQGRDRRIGAAMLGAAALWAAEFLAFWQFTAGDWRWDWTVHAALPAAAVLMAAATALLLWLHHQVWTLRSPTANRILRRYWTYCAVLAAVCCIQGNVDASLHIVLVLVAMLSTPLGLFSGILAAVLNGAQFTLCLGAMGLWSVGEILFHQGLLRRDGVVPVPEIPKNGEDGHGSLDL